MSKKTVPSWVAGIQPFNKLPVGDKHAAGVQKREELCRQALYYQSIPPVVIDAKDLPIKPCTTKFSGTCLAFHKGEGL
jgi:hypothetical protein